MSDDRWVHAGDDVVVLVSQGMEALGQSEIVFAVQTPQGMEPEDVRTQLAGLLEALASHAEQGQVFEPWGWSEFGPDGFLDPEFRGVVYVDPMGLFPEVPQGALLGLLVFAPELDLIKRVGAYRVVTRLGAALRAYPCPLVSSLERAPVAAPDEPAGLLEHVARSYFQGLTLTLIDNVVHVHARPGHGAHMMELLGQLPDPPALAIAADVSAHADARLVWSPGATEPSAISGPGARGGAVAGGQLLIAVTPGADAVQLIEDGFALVCEASTWEALRDAWVEERPVTIPAAGPGGLGLRLTFDGLGGPVDEDFVRLLAPEPQFARATTVEALSGYVSALSVILDGVTDVDVTVELRPGAPPEISWSRPLPDEVVSALYAAPAPEVTEVAPFLIHKAAAVE